MYQGTQFEGLVIQVKEGEATIKLKTGYNLLVPVKDVQDAEQVAGKVSAAAPAPHAPKKDPDLPTVAILHTGGTIASKVDYATGGVLAQFEPEELIAMFPDLSRVANVTSRLVRNMWSDDMRFAHYNIIAHAAAEEIERGITGIIVTSGTDTLHYTAAALSFALEGIGVPVVVVGSQRSSDRGSSDAATNLLGAVRFIAQTRAPGVFVAMHGHGEDERIAIIDGLHARKSHSSRRDAFVSVNAPITARVGETIEVLDGNRLAAWKGRAQDRVRVRPFREDLKVGLWKAHPQAFAEELAIFEHYDGLLIEGTGLGHAPISEMDEHTTEHTRIRERIGHLAGRIPVAMCSQTIFGRVHMDVYSPGRVLQGLGVVGNGCDMHPETAYIKLAWLLSNHTAADVRKLYGTDLRGEITARSVLDAQHREE